MVQIITTSFEQTKKLGSELASKTKGGTTIALYGNLGSGKTTFIQGFAEGLGIAQRIISPTFVLLRTYTGSHFQLIHTDLYRINAEDEVITLGLQDYIDNVNSILAIEWPEKMASLLPKKRKEIQFEYISEQKRRIIIS